MRKLLVRVTPAMLVRMLADAVMVNLALASALLIRFLWTFARHADSPVVNMDEEFMSYASVYLQNALPLTILTLTIFFLHGFYTYSRVYQGKYKALVITTAVLQAYVMYAFLTYFFWNGLDIGHVPRGALALAGLTNLGLTLSSRTWTVVWERLVRPEREARMNARGEFGRNVLIIGGAGYIGSALLPKLLNAGYRVRVLDMFMYGTDPVGDVANHPNLELIEGDFRHVDKVVMAMRDMDAVIHLGAIVGDPACDLDEDVTVEVNLSATQMIAQVAKASGIRRFIFASTCSVYGACDEILSEKSEVKPISLYGNTKLAAERGLQKMATETFCPTIVRFATIYGLSGRTRFDLVVNLLSAKAKIEGKITVHGGSQWRPFVHVDDAALGVFKLLQAPLRDVGNEVFNVGSDDQNRTIEQIGRMIHEQVVGAELLLNEEALDRRNYRVSFKKIRETIGFMPQWTLEEGITQVIDAVTTGHVEDYQDARYSNVKYLRDKGVIHVIRVDDDWSLELSQGRPHTRTEVPASS